MPGAHLSLLPESGVPRLRLGDLILPPQLFLGGRVEPRHVLPGPHGALPPEHPERTLVVTVDVVAEPDEHLRVEPDDGIPDGLQRKAQIKCVVTFTPNQGEKERSARAGVPSST
jgi:hypothetical protein